LDAIYTRLAQAALTIFPNYIKQDACIAATRVGVVVLHSAGFPTEPFPCQVQIFNPQLITLMTLWEKRHRHLPPIPRLV